MKKLFCSLALPLFLASSASAHVTLEAPLRRHANANLLKAGPCGMGGAGDVRGARITTFKPGQIITVTFKETVPHPGFHRLSFSMDGMNFPALPTSATDKPAGQNILYLTDKAGTETYDEQYTLPNVECSNCSLQLLQVMTDKQANGWGNDEFYYQCADLILKADPQTADMASANQDMATAAPDLSSPAADLSSPPFSPPPSTGCNVAGSAGAGSGLGTFLLLGLASLLRRRRRR